MRHAGINPVIVDAGDFFFSSKNINSNNREAQEYRAKAMLEGYEKIGCDAMNVGQYEILNGLSFLKKISKTTKIPFVSSNLKSINDGKLIFEPYKIVQRGNIKIGIIGVTNLLPDTSSTLIADDYIASANNYARILSDKVDIIIALVNTDRGTQNQLIENIPDVDFIVTSGSTNMTRDNISSSENGPYLYSCGKQGKYLITLDVSIKDNDEPFIDISAEEKKIKSINKRFERLQKKDPNKTMEQIYAGQKNILNLIEKYKEDIKNSELIISSAINTIDYRTIPLNKKIKDDEEILSFVNETLKICDNLEPNKVKKSKKSLNKNVHTGHEH